MMIIYIEQNIFTNLLLLSLTCLTILLIILIINLIYKNNKLFFKNKLLTFINKYKKHKDKFTNFFKIENFKIKIANIILFLYTYSSLFYNNDTIYKGLGLLLFFFFVLLYIIFYILSLLNKNITNNKFFKIVESIDVAVSSINPFFVPLSIFAVGTDVATKTGIAILIMLILVSSVEFFSKPNIQFK